MILLTTFPHRLAADRRGITAVEYAVLAAMVATVIAAVQTPFQSALVNAFTAILD